MREADARIIKGYKNVNKLITRVVNEVFWLRIVILRPRAHGSRNDQIANSIIVR
jgi:hypothetical protein